MASGHIGDMNMAHQIDILGDAVNEIALIDLVMVGVEGQ